MWKSMMYDVIPSMTGACRDMKDVQLDFHEIHREFRPRILRYLARMVGEAEAEDLTQEVFAKVARALGAFRGESSLSTWIYRIATNTALDAMKKPLFRQMVTEGKVPLEEIAGAGKGDLACADGGNPSPDERVIRGEMNACIREVIETLPANYRTCIVLSDLEDLSDAEIAEVLGLSLQAAKIRLHRARARLRERLEASCVFYRDERNEVACDRKSVPCERTDTKGERD
jgi:RNA polymerase sigma-70 factor (ECF subfamily)